MEKKVTKLNLFLRLRNNTRIIIIFIILVLIISLIIGFIIFFNNKKNKLSEESIKMYQEANKFYLERKLDLSIEVLKKLIKKNRSFVNAHFMLGKAYFFKGEQKEARKTWENILRLNPNHIDTLIWLGILYTYDKESMPEAIDYFNRVLRLDSLNLLANYNLAKIFFNQKEYKKSLYYFNNAIENEYHLAEVHIDLANIYIELDLGSRAITELKKAKNLTTSKIVLEEIESKLESISNKIENEKEEEGIKNENQ